MDGFTGRRDCFDTEEEAVAMAVFYRLAGKPYIIYHHAKGTWMVWEPNR